MPTYPLAQCLRKVTVHDTSKTIVEVKTYMNQPKGLIILKFPDGGFTLRQTDLKGIQLNETTVYVAGDGFASYYCGSKELLESSYLLLRGALANPTDEDIVIEARRLK